MKGTVYRINFPTGEFYIGSTKRTLAQRFYNHHKGDNYGYVSLKATLLAKYSEIQLLDMTEVLYIGENFRDYEGYLIEENQDSINVIQPKYNMENALNIKDIITNNAITFKKKPHMDMNK